MTHTYPYMCVDLEHGTLAVVQPACVVEIAWKWKPHEEFAYTCSLGVTVCKSCANLLV